MSRHAGALAGHGDGVWHPPLAAVRGVDLGASDPCLTSHPVARIQKTVWAWRCRVCWIFKARVRKRCAFPSMPACALLFVMAFVTLRSHRFRHGTKEIGMRLPRRLGNPALAALLNGGGFPSLERFAMLVNQRGWDVHGVKLSYDHISVKRWLAGSTCQYPDVVAEVISDAWGIPVPVAVIWPELRDGRASAPAHLQPWVADRTLEELSLFIRSDMLTRRGLLASAVTLTSGKALTDPIGRWLGTDDGIGFSAIGHDGPGQINIATVDGIEQATRHFMTADAAVGGGIIREAAVGHLKHVVDLATDARYSEAVGNRLLAAVADLAGWVGWMSHDMGMEGPAQRYLVFALQAAREARGNVPRLRAVGLLVDMARQMQAVGHPDTGLRLVDLAFDHLPTDGRRLNKVRSLLWSMRAQLLGGMGAAQLSEARSAVALAFDLYGQRGEEDATPAVTTCFPYTTDAELASGAATCYRQLAEHDRTLAAEAERHALHALAHRPDGFARSRVFDQIELARARFLADEPEQACVDGHQAVQMASQVTASSRVTARLWELGAETRPYKEQSEVKELRERLALS
jgi:hypothetical protein